MVTQRMELLERSRPRGEWVICIHKLTGQPYCALVMEFNSRDGIKRVKIPYINQEITSTTYGWEIIV